MKKFAIFFIAMAGLASMAFYIRKAPQASKTFIVIYTPGKGWDTSKSPDKQAYFASHSRHLSALRKAGTIITGGRYADKGMLLVKAEDEQAARQAILAADSAVIGGTFSAELYAYSAFYDGCITR